MSSAAEYVLLASVFYQRQQDGTRKRFHKGDTITGLSEDTAHRLLKIRAIARPGDEPPADVAEPDTSVESTADVEGKPPADANKPELVEWIYENVAKADGSDYTKTELNRMNKDELVEIIESVD